MAGGKQGLLAKFVGWGGSNYSEDTEESHRLAMLQISQGQGTQVQTA